MTRLIPCSSCHQDFEQRKLKRVCGLWYCRYCYINHRKGHREETIENTNGLKEELKILKNKASNESRVRNYIPKPKKVIPIPSYSEPMTIRGAHLRKTGLKSNSYLTYEEKKVYPKIIDHPERLDMVLRQQEIIRKIQKEEIKSKEEEIENSKINKKKLLEGLK